MKIMPLSLRTPGAVGAGDPADRLSRDRSPDAASFGRMLKQAVARVNELQLEANKAAVEIGTGENANIHETMIALEKANLSMQLLLQVRNKVVEAYREVMRMQV